MRYSRAPIGPATAFDLEAVKEHARIDWDDEDAAVSALASAAVAEIEAYCGIALLRQTIRVELTSWAECIALPVGPVDQDALVAQPVTIWTRDNEGELTEQPNAGWIWTGRYPHLHLMRPLEGSALVVEYPAGFGTTAAAIPADLALAVADQTTRLYGCRGDDAKAEQGLSVAATRICARHRQVKV